MAPTLLWIGLGNMGRAMCKNIVEKGNLDSPLLIYNRSKQRAVDLSQKLPAGKTEVVDSLVDAVAKADVIFSCVANDDALIAVLAGPAASVDRARPWFVGVTARADVDMSDLPYGRATTLKVIGNTFVLNMVEQLAEAHVLAEKSGLGTRPLHDLVGALFPGPHAAYSERMLSGDYHRRSEPLWAVDLARKDARHARALAEAAGTTLANVETADRHLASLKEHSGPSGDIAAIYGVVRMEAGLKFENDA
ncbi:6-phosphogluconate dehydrogenase 2 [Cordyceps fumosorosea ARSEF 2679]|uniref:6-phosphogluconate dehydrogenase 2 n=1 Tax=Cordyceps fumosorosea (strain ARSEF 2679) TaxID=1081104 RepID=A0A162LDG8_CORFA|nr:6-phosphogluconate dehydrogenase 2 [Cordyceps fumosorosea ARSEF 2679]OAA69054.1 6-phosphogluconate dehydrogenase 2 [Cordyceps fumosorosea ARSEF 2679]